MSDRRRQQEHLAKTIQSSPSKLTMNQGDAFRETQEERWGWPLGSGPLVFSS